MFIETDERLVNLKNISNIVIIEKTKRIVFNMNYTIELKRDKFISDYVYWDSRTEESFQEKIDKIMNIQYFQDNFFSGTDIHTYININEVSSVKFIDNTRVIFNMSHPVSYKDKTGEFKLTSEFIYIDCPNTRVFNEYKNYINYIKGA